MSVADDSQFNADQAEEARIIAEITAARPAVTAPISAPPPAVAAPPPVVVAPPEPVAPPVDPGVKTPPQGGGATPIAETVSEIDEIAREAQRRLEAEETRLAAGRRQRAAPPKPADEPPAPILTPEAQATSDKLESMGIDVKKMAEANGISPSEFAWIIQQQMQGKAGPWKPSHAGVAEDMRALKAEVQQLKDELAAAGQAALEQEETSVVQREQQHVQQLEQQRDLQIRTAAQKRIEGAEFKAKYKHVAVQDPGEMAEAVAAAFSENRRLVAAGQAKPLTADQVFAWMENSLAEQAKKFAPLYEKPAPVVASPAPTVAPAASSVAPGTSSGTPPLAVQGFAQAEMQIAQEFPEVRLSPGEDATEILAVLRTMKQASIGR